MGESEVCMPHLPQKWAPSGIGSPHWVQNRADAAGLAGGALAGRPHCPQNFCPWAMAVPHDGQRSSCPRGLRFLAMSAKALPNPPPMPKPIDRKSVV